MAADYKTLLGLVHEFLGEPPGTRSMELIDRARTAIGPSKPKNDVKVLHAWPDVFADACCAGRLTRAAREGKLDTADSWDCPGCGTHFLPTNVDNIRRWEAVVELDVFHLP